MHARVVCVSVKYVYSCPNVPVDINNLIKDIQLIGFNTNLYSIVTKRTNIMMKKIRERTSKFQ